MKRIMTLILVLCMLLSACGTAKQPQVAAPQEDIPVVNQPVAGQPVTNLVDSQIIAPKAGTYNPGVVLVKVDGELTSDMLAQTSAVSSEPLYAGSQWYLLTLAEDADTVEAVESLRQLGCFDAVDYDYIMGVTDKPEDNEKYDDQVNLGLSNIPHGWTVNGKHPGGSPDVVIAVIDTGVDYNHLDLRNNIWVNTAEIPDNGRDDDGNGYVDDVYGWDCVGDDNDPMDDNGHGTHVAGIIAAENNKIGGIGVAYGCKVMVLKAGNSSGYFNNSDIAEAIQYAYMNGASVINMSFGGGNISIAVEDALQNAYNSCVLVAAAGNSGGCNVVLCSCGKGIGPTYPAALPYVIGVMSVDKDGKHISSFSNYDHHPYDSVEYEVYAVGEGVGSTWPTDKYACLNGTSMAAPTVAGIAALLRSYYTDREVYSTKFIQSQIVNTGTVHPHILDHAEDSAHSVADAGLALTKLPKPNVNLYDYRIDDSTSICEANNGNGVIDAGETVRLYISLHNRGGVASNVNVTIDTYRREVGDETMTDPYFTFVNSAISLSDIGTYSIREAYVDEYFEIIVDPNCPNDYRVDFNIRFTYENGLDEKDKETYSGDGTAQFNVSRGYHLPGVITEDTVFTADRLYIVGEDVVIPAGVTVTFEEGCQIQFYDDRSYLNSPRIIVYGTLKLSGTKENMITVKPSERLPYYVCFIEGKENGTIVASAVDATNLVVRATAYISNSYLCTQGGGGYGQCDSVYRFDNGSGQSANNGMVMGGYITDSYIELTTYWTSHYISEVRDCCILYAGYTFTSEMQKADNNLFITKYSHNARIKVFKSFTGNRVQALNELKGNVVPFSFASEAIKDGNEFSPIYQQYASQAIDGYYDSTGTPIIDVYGPVADASLLWPYVVSVEIFDKDGNPITRVGKEEIKVRVTFNRPMDTTKDTYLTFGTIEPYADYRIDGSYVSDTVWEGTYTLKAQIENGQNFLKVNNACAAEDQTKTVFGEYQLHEFTIDTTAAMSMNLQAVATTDGINLTWFQDDYDTLLGYNIYRSEEKDGYYTKLNPAILLPTDESFLDENAEPGKTYWYTYTVVLTDFSESAPAGRVTCTAWDTIRPNMYHTPVNQGYANNNLVISCTASDNISIASVTLYYRTIGADSWKSLTMSKQNDKYSATIFGSDVTLAGLEYYIVAIDGGGNTVAKGSAETPYTVVVKDASVISRLGDVNGDGTVTTKDALMIMQAINGDLRLTDDEFKRADLNKDGILSSMEALRILQYINGNVTTLEM